MTLLEFRVCFDRLLAHCTLESRCGQAAYPQDNLRRAKVAAFKHGATVQVVDASARPTAIHDQPAGLGAAKTGGRVPRQHGNVVLGLLLGIVVNVGLALAADLPKVVDTVRGFEWGWLHSSAAPRSL